MEFFYKCDMPTSELVLYSRWIVSFWYALKVITEVVLSCNEPYIYIFDMPNRNFPHNIYTFVIAPWNVMVCVISTAAVLDFCMHIIHICSFYYNGGLNVLISLLACCTFFHISLQSICGFVSLHACFYVIVSNCEK